MLNKKVRALSPAVEALCARWGSRVPEVSLVAAINKRFADIRNANLPAPVDTSRLARLVNARVELSPIGVDGRLSTLGGGGFLIELKRDAPRRRQRFTCAHELGHVLFVEALGLDDALRQRAGRISECNDDVDRVEERLCDYAAAELLMPTIPFYTDVNSARPSSRAVKDLATKYDVSLHAAAKRIADLSKVRQAICLFNRDQAAWNLTWIVGPAGAVRDGVTISPSSRLAREMETGEDFAGRFVLSLGAVADELSVDAILMGPAARRYLLMAVQLRPRAGSERRGDILESSPNN